MLQRRMFGDTELIIVPEFSGPTHDRDWMLPDSNRSQMEEMASVVNDRFWLPRTDRLIFAIQIFVLKRGDEVILIDTGVGNHKLRPPGWQCQLNTPLMDWLKGIGAGPDAVTDVVHTHLHGDHIGWNTTLGAAGWEPTFPKATWWMPRVDYETYAERYSNDATLFGGGFADSVKPIVDAGLARFFEPGDRLCDLLDVIDGAGHSAGQVALVLDGIDDSAIFTADILHSPLQVRHPEINSRWCELPELARSTRQRILKHASDRPVRLYPAHSSAIDGWRISRNRSGFGVDI